MPDIYKVIPLEPFETVPSRCIAKAKDVRGETVLTMNEKDYLSVKDKCRVVHTVELEIPKKKKMSAKPRNKMVSETENKSIDNGPEGPWNS